MVYSVINEDRVQLEPRKLRLVVTEAQRAAIERALSFASLNSARWTSDDASALALVQAAGPR